MTELAYDQPYISIEDAAPLIREMNDTKSFIMIPAPLFKLLENKGLSLQAYALYNFIFGRASLNQDYCARLKMKDILEFTGKAPSTVRAYMVELESHGLIERLYRSLGQKTVLIGCKLTFSSIDSEALILKSSNRKGREVTRIENDNHSPLSPQEENLCLTTDNQRCPSPDNKRLNNNTSSVSKQQNTNNSTKSSKGSDPTSEFVFSIFSLNEGNYALSKLADMAYTGKRGMEIMEQMAYSFQRGKWKGDRRKAINSMLKLIRQNKWRSPF